MQVTELKLTDIKPYENNPRVNAEAVASLARIIRDLGFRNPILVNRDHVIIAGHTRWEAVKSLGWETIPCIVEDDLTPDQERALRIADNKVAEIAEWDEEKLKVEMKLLEDAGFDLSTLAFQDDELDAILGGDALTPGETESDAVPEVPEVADSKPGEIYVLGAHRLLCGDATKAEDVKKLLGEGEADLWLTDPPYNVSYEGSNGLTIQNDSMEDVKFREFLRAAFGCAEKALKPGAPFYIFHADSEGYNFRGACHDVGLRVRQCLVWKKNALVLGRQDYQWIHEPCLYGWKDGAAHSWYGDRAQTTVMEYNKPKKNDVHPCLTEDTKVMTSGGLKPIAEIALGDKVLSSDGRFHRVHLVTYHPYHEKIYTIGTLGSNFVDRATHDHKYLVATRNAKGGYDVRWVKAEDLKVGDRLMVPRMRDGAYGPVSNLDAYCYGLWLAQGTLLKAGHGKHRYPVFSIDSRKTHLLEAIRSWGRGRRIGVHYAKDRLGCTVIVFDPAKGAECERLCGKGAYGKRMADDVLAWREDLRRSFLDGYVDGDGWRFKERNEIRIHTVSPSLAGQIATLAWSVGYRPAVYLHKAGRGGIGERKFKRTLPFYDLYLYPGENAETVRYSGAVYRLARIKSIRSARYNGEVWNIGVEGTHTFLTANGMTKNTMKPVEMLVYLLRNSTQRGNLVLDTFGGSGSTLIACEESGRVCRTMELDPKYCDVIRRRWAEFKSGEGCDWKAMTRPEKCASEASMDS